MVARELRRRRVGLLDALLLPPDPAWVRLRPRVLELGGKVCSGDEPPPDRRRVDRVAVKLVKGEGLVGLEDDDEDTEKSERFLAWLGRSRGGGGGSGGEESGLLMVREAWACGDSNRAVSDKNERLA